VHDGVTGVTVGLRTVPLSQRRALRASARLGCRHQRRNENRPLALIEPFTAGITTTLKPEPSAWFAEMNFCPISFKLREEIPGGKINLRVSLNFQ
jgi:hypothetical protein